MGNITRTCNTMADTRSRARIRILISWSLRLASIMSWYSATRYGWLGTIFAIANNAIYFTDTSQSSSLRWSVEYIRFWSGSCTKVASLETQSLAKESPLIPCNIPPMIHVWTHSYRRDIAGVVEIRSVIGGWSFLTSRGSCGESEPN